MRVIFLLTVHLWKNRKYGSQSRTIWQQFKSIPHFYTGSTVDCFEALFRSSGLFLWQWSAGRLFERYCKIFYNMKYHFVPGVLHIFYQLMKQVLVTTQFRQYFVEKLKTEVDLSLYRTKIAFVSARVRKNYRIWHTSIQISSSNQIISFK